MDFTGKINLLKFKNSCIVTVKGKTETKRGVFIPITDNNLFISADEDLKAKGAYVDFSVWNNNSADKFGYTHSIKQSFRKEVRDKMTEEEKKTIPYLGSMKPYEMINAAQSISAAAEAEPESEEDLPF